MFGVFSVLLMTGLTLLTLLHLRRNHPIPKWLIPTEGILCAVGVLAHPLILVILRVRLQNSGFTEDFASWAWDAVTTYLQYALPALGIFGGIPFLCALFALFEKKYRAALWVRLRSLCLLASSVVLLALAAFFGAMSVTAELALEWAVYLLGTAGVLVLRGMYLPEAFCRRAERS